MNADEGGSVPDTVKNLLVLRGDSERRNAWIRWRPQESAIGYSIYMGSAPDKLYNSVMALDKNEYFFNAMDKNMPYYF